MHKKLKGLVISETDFGENNKYITILTDEGKIEVLCTGARKRGSPLLTCTRLFCYAEFTLYKGKGKYMLNEGEIITHFIKISSDIEKYALSCYFCDLSDLLADAHFTGEEFLQLILYALYAISEKNRPSELVRSAFELKSMCLSGFMPAFDVCAICSETEHIKDPVFFPKAGIITCGKCADKMSVGGGVKLSDGVFRAILYIMNAEMKKLFSFNIGEENSKILSVICEDYLLTSLGIKPKTLEFYKGFV